LQISIILYGMKTKDMLALVGENIRNIRKGRKMSQERLAELSDMHPSHISDIENGKVNASLTAYFQIANALNVPTSEVVSIALGKSDRKTEASLVELFSMARNLDRKQKVIFISASRGLIAGIEKS